MSFIQIVGPLDVFNRAVDAIQDTGLLHVEEVPLAEGDGANLLHRAHLSDRQLRQKDTYAELARLLDEEAVRHVPHDMLPDLRRSRAFSEQFRRWSGEGAAAITSSARALHAEVRSFVRRRRNLDDDLRVLTAYEEVVAALAPLVESQELPEGYQFVGVVFQRKNRQARSLLHERLRQLTAGRCRFLETPLRKGHAAALLGFHKQFAAPVHDFIAKVGISEIRGPRYLRDKPFEHAIATLEKDLAGLREQRGALQKQTAKFFSERGAELLALWCVCHDRASRLDAITKFAQTSYTFIMEGWVPTQRLKHLHARLSESCGPAIVLRKLKAHGAANSPPVLLDNPGPVRPFENLLALLPLPKYGTVDPTSFVATFFPPIFGLMLADIGYGLLLAIAALVIWVKARRNRIARALTFVLGCCAFFTIVFGFVFGEFFGTAGRHLGLQPLWRGRLELDAANKGEALLGYLILAVAVGAAHVLCGLVLGIINAQRSGERGRFLSCAARIAGLFGLFFIVGRLAQFLPPVFTSIGVIAMLIFFVLMVRTSMRHPSHGLTLPLELLGTVGNILSYARIMAVGMASAVLALLANRFGSMIGNLLLAGIVVVLIHALNLVLGVVDPTIQGLRLHYVEFFSKFYETGGRPYSPFRRMGESA